MTKSPLHMFERASTPASSAGNVANGGSVSVAPSRDLASASTHAYPKRAFDIAVSGFLLVVLAPLLALIFIALLISDGRPIFFRQSRIGKDGRTFSCLKFRSMVKDADIQLQKLLARSPESRAEWNETQKLRNDPRVHFVGKILRKTSLDELPQFFNVLKGDMSVVGPRPIVQHEVERYGKHIAHYNSARPGITGLWQVSGRNSVSYDRRVSLDVEYVNNVSLKGDLVIIAKTFAIVALAKGDH